MPNSIQFTGENAPDVETFLDATIEVLIGDPDADPALRIAGKRYFLYDLPRWRDPQWYAHIVEGDWLERTATGIVIRWYPEQYAEVYG